MSARTGNRLRALAGALPTLFGSRSRPADPRRILVLHELLLGDTIMLAPLLKALRSQHPQAEIFVTVKPGYAALFAGRPYGVRALPYSEEEPDALQQLAAARDSDLAILPGEGRHVLAARALGAKWIVGFAGARPAWRGWLLDEAVPMPATPTALAEMFASLAGFSQPVVFQTGEWPAPAFEKFDRPETPYAVLHVGAGSPLRLWLPGRWREVASVLEQKNLQIVLSAGRGEEGIAREIDPQGRYTSVAGKLDLAQLWQLLANAKLLVTLDTGIAHLAKLTGTRTAALYGPGSALLFGRGEFWRAAPFREVTVHDFPCRDQRHVFKRELHWVRRCNRTLAECPRARCMEAISAEQVRAAIQ